MVLALQKVTHFDAQPLNSFGAGLQQVVKGKLMEAIVNFDYLVHQSTPLGLTGSNPQAPHYGRVPLDLVAHPTLSLSET